MMYVSCVHNYHLKNNCKWGIESLFKSVNKWLTLSACRETGRQPDNDCRRSSSGSCCTTCSSVNCWGLSLPIGSFSAAAPKTMHDQQSISYVVAMLGVCSANAWFHSISFQVVDSQSLLYVLYGWVITATTFAICNKVTSTG